MRWWLRLALLVARGLSRIGVRPGAVTMTGLLTSLAVPAVVPQGGSWLFVAAGLVFVSALADSTDGAVALLTSRTSQLGAYYDSVADRVSEAAWLLALWLLGVPGLLISACGALAWLHEYARARAAASGMSGVGTITAAERPTRVILVVAALAVGGLAGLVNPRAVPGVATFMVSIWLLLGLMGASRLATAIRAALR